GTGGRPRAAAGGRPAGRPPVGGRARRRRHRRRDGRAQGGPRGGPVVRVEARGGRDPRHGRVVKGLHPARSCVWLPGAAVATVPPRVPLPTAGGPGGGPDPPARGAPGV